MKRERRENRRISADRNESSIFIPEPPPLERLIRFCRNVPLHRVGSKAETCFADGPNG